MISVRCWQPQPGGHRYPGDGRAIVQMNQGASTGRQTGRFDMDRSKKRSNIKPQPKWTDVKAGIADLPSSKLVALVGDLYRMSRENRDFLHARFAPGDDPLAPYKKIIGASLYPDVVHGDSVSIETAKRAIRQYARACPDEAGMLELMVHFVETGHQFTLDYGDIDGPFYDSLLRMYKEAIEQLLGLGDEAIREYLPRFRHIKVSSDGIGWGYHDDLADMYENHLRPFEQRSK